MRIKLLILFLAIISCNAIAQSNHTKSLVNIIPAPIGSLVPDVFMDNNGTLHMVYAWNQNAWYVRSTNNGLTFSTPVKVNSTGNVEDKMGERGPKISVGADGVIHVAWMDLWAVGVNTFARYSRSTNGGLSFSSPVAVSSTSGIDGVTLAADGFNHVVVFWHTMVPVQTQIPQATWLHLARSINNGVGFSPDTNVVIANHNGLACSMCMTRARFGPDGNVYCAFRSAKDSVRDFFVIKGNPANNSFTAVRVNYDNWKINYCPMVGPELEKGKNGKQLCAFMSNDHVYWAISDSGLNTFTQHVATPLQENDELFPTAIENNAGLVLFLWQVGPMSINDSSIVKWAVYNASGSFTGQQGTVGKTFSGTKATAYVGTDDNFYIVVNTDIITSVTVNQDSPDINIYPNPVSQKLTITSRNNKPLNISVFDLSGKLMIQKELSDPSQDIDISLLPKGVYLIEVTCQDWSVKRKFLKD